MLLRTRDPAEPRSLTSCTVACAWQPAVCQICASRISFEPLTVTQVLDQVSLLTFSPSIPPQHPPLLSPLGSCLLIIRCHTISKHCLHCWIEPSDCIPIGCQLSLLNADKPTNAIAEAFSMIPWCSHVIRLDISMCLSLKQQHIPSEHLLLACKLTFPGVPVRMICSVLW